MADWNTPIPGEAVEGADTHVDDHNALNAVAVEQRARHDALEATVDALEVPDVSGLATEQYVDDAVAGVEVPSLDGYARTEDLPDTSGLATDAALQSLVDEVAALTARVADLEDAATAE